MSIFGFISRALLALVGIVLSALLLWITSRLFRTRDTGFKTAFRIALIIGVVNLVIGYVFAFMPLHILGNFVNFVATAVLGVLLIKSSYKVDLARAVLMWLVWIVMAFIIAAILFAIFGALMMGIALTTGSMFS